MEPFFELVVLVPKKRLWRFSMKVATAEETFFNQHSPGKINWSFTWILKNVPGKLLRLPYLYSQGDSKRFLVQVVGVLPSWHWRTARSIDILWKQSLQQLTLNGNHCSAKCFPGHSQFLAVLKLLKLWRTNQDHTWRKYALLWTMMRLPSRFVFVSCTF